MGLPAHGTRPTRKPVWPSLNLFHGAQGGAGEGRCWGPGRDGAQGPRKGWVKAPRTRPSQDGRGQGLSRDALNHVIRAFSFVEVSPRSPGAPMAMTPWGSGLGS